MAAAPPPPTLPPSPPPPFGHALLPYFALDPAYTNLNNGSFGSPPRHVLAAGAALAAEIEANPDAFIRIALPRRLDAVRAALAPLLGAAADEVVLVPNVAHGLHTVLRNIPWDARDTIVISNTTYDTVARAARSIAAAAPHPALSVFPLLFPTSPDAILAAFRAHLAGLRAAAAAADGYTPKIVVLFDSIVSTPGARLPWRAMVAACREARALSLVDGAHSLGQEPLDLAADGPDFFVASCNKWLYAKRGCAVLYVPRRNQHLIAHAVPPGLAYLPASDEEAVSPFVSQFYWTGSTDLVPYLSVPAALEFRAALGGERAINAYCGALARAGGARLAALLGTEVLDPDGAFTANMVNVALPLRVRASAAAVRRIHAGLLAARGAYAAQFHHHGRWWVRASAQVFNEIADFDVLGAALLDLCAELERELGVE